MTLHPALLRRWLFQGGFTLIELLVVIMLIGLVVGGGIAGYSRYNARQLVFQSGYTFMSVLRTAQKHASAGQKPGGCQRLLGYSVVGNASGGANCDATLCSYTLNAVCSNATYPDSTYSLQRGSTFYQNVNVFFEALTGSITDKTLPLPIYPPCNYVDVYLGNVNDKYFGVRIRESGSLFVINADLVDIPASIACP